MRPRGEDSARARANSEGVSPTRIRDSFNRQARRGRLSSDNLGSPVPPHRRHAGDQTSRRFDSLAENGSSATSGPQSAQLVTLADLIRKDDTQQLIFKHDHGDGDADLPADLGDNPAQMLGNGTVGSQDALQAAEHGNSMVLAKYLQDGGDPHLVSRLHHMRWSLLHLAAGCATMGGAASFGGAYRSRPEPDCTDGYATCVSLLLAAGANPNAASRQGGHTPLMGACLTGSMECCWLLLRAGAKPDARTDAGQTAFDFARKARFAASGGAEAVLRVLHTPPRLVPRSPVGVTARLLERRTPDGDDEEPIIEVRWRIPRQDSLLPTRCGEIERYMVKCWCQGKVVDVVQSTSNMSRAAPRRDFCRNAVVDRGVALRKNLCLPPPQTASVVVHNLQPGLSYAFAVSIICEVDGVLSQSPPSCISRAVFVPAPREESQWSVGGVISMVMATGGGGGSGSGGLGDDYTAYSVGGPSGGGGGGGLREVPPGRYHAAASAGGGGASGVGVNSGGVMMGGGSMNQQALRLQQLQQAQRQGQMQVLEGLRQMNVAGAGGSSAGGSISGAPDAATSQQQPPQPLLQQQVSFSYSEPHTGRLSLHVPSGADNTALGEGANTSREQQQQKQNQQQNQQKQQALIGGSPPSNKTNQSNQQQEQQQQFGAEENALRTASADATQEEQSPLSQDLPPPPPALGWPSDSSAASESSQSTVPKNGFSGGGNGFPNGPNGPARQRINSRHAASPPQQQNYPHRQQQQQKQQQQQQKQQNSQQRQRQQQQQQAAQRNRSQQPEEEGGCAVS